MNEIKEEKKTQKKNPQELLDKIASRINQQTSPSKDKVLDRNTFKSTRTKSYMIPSRVDVFKAKSLDNVDFKYKLLKKLDDKNKWDEEFFNQIEKYIPRANVFQIENYQKKNNQSINEIMEVFQDVVFDLEKQQEKEKQNSYELKNQLIETRNKEQILIGQINELKTVKESNSNQKSEEQSKQIADSQIQINNLKNLIESQKQQIQMWSESFKTQKKEIEQKQSQVDQLVQDLAAEKQQKLNKSGVQLRSESKIDMIQMNESIAKLNFQLQEQEKVYNQKLAFQETQLESAETEKKEIRKQNVDLYSRINDKDKQIAELTSENQKIKKQNTRLSVIGELQGQNEVLVNQSKELQNQVEKVKYELKMKGLEKENIENEKKRIEQEKRNVEKQLETARNENEEKTNKIKEIKEQLRDQYRNEIEKKLEEVDYLKIELEKKQEESQRIQDKLKEKIQKMEEIQTKNKDLDEKIKKLENEMEKVNIEKDKMQIIIQTKEQALIDLVKEKKGNEESYEKQIKQLQEEKVKLNQLQSERQASSASSEQIINQINAQLSEKTQKLQFREQELEQSSKNLAQKNLEIENLQQKFSLLKTQQSQSSQIQDEKKTDELVQENKRLKEEKIKQEELRTQQQKSFEQQIKHFTVIIQKMTMQMTETEERSNSFIYFEKQNYFQAFTQEEKNKLTEKIEKLIEENEDLKLQLKEAQSALEAQSSQLKESNRNSNGNEQSFKNERGSSIMSEKSDRLSIASDRYSIVEQFNEVHQKGLEQFYNNPGEESQSIMKINDEYNALVHQQRMVKVADKEKSNLVKRAQQLLKRNKVLSVEEKLKIQTFLLTEYKKKMKEQANRVLELLMEIQYLKRQMGNFSVTRLSSDTENRDSLLRPQLYRNIIEEEEMSERKDSFTLDSFNVPDIQSRKSEMPMNRRISENLTQKILNRKSQIPTLHASMVIVDKESEKSEKDDKSFQEEGTKSQVAEFNNSSVKPKIEQSVRILVLNDDATEDEVYQEGLSLQNKCVNFFGKYQQMIELSKEPTFVDDYKNLNTQFILLVSKWTDFKKFLNYLEQMLLIYATTLIEKFSITTSSGSTEEMEWITKAELMNIHTSEIMMQLKRTYLKTNGPLEDEINQTFSRVNEFLSQYYPHSRRMYIYRRNYKAQKFDQQKHEFKTDKSVFMLKQTMYSKIEKILEKKCQSCLLDQHLEGICPLHSMSFSKTEGVLQFVSEWAVSTKNPIFKFNKMNKVLQEMVNEANIPQTMYLHSQIHSFISSASSLILLHNLSEITKINELAIEILEVLGDLIQEAKSRQNKSEKKFIKLSFGVERMRAICMITQGEEISRIGLEMQQLQEVESDEERYNE